uniref:Granulins domain-containing protein n=1 Tax=Xiphophorus couchianus TaxID=32473 RepID=A0A3B5LBN6_9TELE
MCDGQTSCPKDTTCCFMERTHKWGCCPLPEVGAVCCKDGIHCCPSGHTCDPHRTAVLRATHATCKLKHVTRKATIWSSPLPF